MQQKLLCCSFLLTMKPEVFCVVCDIWGVNEGPVTFQWLTSQPFFIWLCYEQLPLYDSKFKSLLQKIEL